MYICMYMINNYQNGTCYIRYDTIKMKQKQFEDNDFQTVLEIYKY